MIRIIAVLKGVAMLSRQNLNLRFTDSLAAILKERAMIFARKLAYSMGFESWQWAIGSGIYIDDVDAIYRRIMWQFAGFAGILMLIAGVIVFLSPAASAVL